MKVVTALFVTVALITGAGCAQGEPNTEAEFKQADKSLAVIVAKDLKDVPEFRNVCEMSYKEFIQVYTEGPPSARAVYNEMKADC